MAELDTEKAKEGCIGCLALLALIGGCSALVSVMTPEKMTKKCEKDLQSRYSLTGYSLKRDTGFVTVSEGKEVEIIAFQFRFDGKKGSSIADQEQAAPLLKGLAYCRIEKKSKKVKTTFEQVKEFSGVS